MRLPNDRRIRRAARLACALIPALALGACGIVGGKARGEAALPVAPGMARLGPQADYPVVVGPAYSVAGVSFTPEDVLNYDQVGFVAADTSASGGVSGAHHTLPLPSYVEVTSLATGRTILVRIERRGPMAGTELVALSPGALAQLGSAAGTPVRVRRVNPPEEQRALLRAGHPAPQRIDTPMPLVEVLKRKLPAGSSRAGIEVAQVAPSTAPPAPAVARTAPVAAAPRQAAPTLAQIATGPVTASAERAVPALPSLDSRPAQRAAAPVNVPSAGNVSPSLRASAQTAASGKFMVQAAAFSTSERAAGVASALGGAVAKAGSVFRVRTGPFATRSEAEASLAKVRAAGYRDARIQNSG
jgi:rare lipoprotein A